MTSESDENVKQKRFSYSRFKLGVAEMLKWAKLIFPLLKPHFFALLLHYALKFIETCMQWMAPIYVGGIIDIVTRSKSTEHLWSLLRDMTIFTLFSTEITEICKYVNHKTDALFSNSLKKEAYRRILACDLEFFDKASPGEVQEILDNGMENLIYLCLYEFTDLLMAGFSTFGNLYSLYLVSPELANIVLITLPFRIFLSVLSLHSRADSKKYDKLYSLYLAAKSLPLQAIQNIFLVKSFSAEEKEHKEYADTLKELQQSKDECWIEPWFSSRVRRVITEGVNLFLLYRGGQMVFDGKMTVGDLSMFNMYSTNLTEKVTLIHSHFKNAYDAYKKSTQALKLLEESSKPKDRESEKKTKPQLKGTISINNVSFRYPAKPEVEVLTDINLKINAGESIAFVGLSGSGKTTLSYLLQNLYTPTEGKIFIDGEDIRDYDINPYRGGVFRPLKNFFDLLNFNQVKQTSSMKLLEHLSNSWDTKYSDRLRRHDEIEILRNKRIKE